MTAMIADDRSRSFASSRAGLTDRDGQPYDAFLKTLTPRYGIVWRDILLGYAALIATLAVLALVPQHWGFAVPGILSIGYWIAYLQLFLHEGAHFNLHRDRQRNDTLCNAFIGWMIGSDIASYRIVHWQHHRNIGTVHDSEFTYFFPLNLSFLLRVFFGVRAIEVLLARRKLTGGGKREPAEPAKAKSPAKSPHARAVLGAGLLIHGLIIVLLAWISWIACVAWVLGVGMAFPAFGALRQLLEHRSPMADPSVDYTKLDHGAYTRMFGDGPVASTFGGAGFNRHLLHHWEPQVSYTRLAELEGFFLSTDLAPILKDRSSTYLQAFRGLFRW